MTKEELKKNYEKACNDYVKALCEMWGDSYEHAYWMSNKAGGLLGYSSEYAIAFKEIRYCVDNDITQAEFGEYSEYCTRVTDALGERAELPTLEQWHKGEGNRYPEESFAKIENMKRELEKLANETLKEF